MSMNLEFKHKTTADCYVDFPFQTPTDLTLAVLNCADNNERLLLVREHLIDHKNKEWVKSTLIKVEELLQDPDFELIMI